MKQHPYNTTIEMNCKIFLCFIAFVLGSNVEISAHPPWGIAVDREGNIYFADILHNGMGTVWKIHTDGTAEALLKNFHAHNVNLDNRGNLYTSHGEESQFLVRISTSGKIDTLLFEHEYARYNGGNSMVTPDGRIVFGIEKSLWEYHNGKRSKIHSDKLDWNQALFADDNGTIYATDIGDGLGRVVKFTSNGESATVANRLITRLDRPYDPHMDVLLGMAMDKNERLYVAETAGQRIIQIENGEAFTYYKSEGSWFPTAITFHDNDAIILEYKWENGLKGPRVIRYTNETRSVVWDFANQ